jgi:hypothetical protein
MATLECKPSVRLQEAILHATSLGYELRKTTRESRKNIDHSRRLMKETKVILDQSRLIILASQRLTFKG